MNVIALVPMKDTSVRVSLEETRKAPRSRRGIAADSRSRFLESRERSFRSGVDLVIVG